MAFSDFFRGGRDRPHRDEQQWQDPRSRQESRHFGRYNYPQDEQGFGRGRSAQGSDFYGDNPERYAQGGWGAVRSQEDDRFEYRGAGNDWGRRDNRYGGESGGRMQSGSSFNDRWQNAYGAGGGFGREQYGRSSSGSGYEGQGREDERWWNEMSGRGSGDMSSARTGSFRGRGPKGYRRSDERVREDVCECLTEDERIDATNIQVAVKECEVTLTGTVNSREEKRRAEDLIDRLPGVKDVHNTLRVVNEGGAVESSTSSMRNEQAGSSSTTQSASSPSGPKSDDPSSRH